MIVTDPYKSASTGGLSKEVIDIILQVDFWIGYDSHSQGLILHPHCPFDYCTLETISLRLNSTDLQCAQESSQGRERRHAAEEESCLREQQSLQYLLSSHFYKGRCIVLRWPVPAAAPPLLRECVGPPVPGPLREPNAAGFSVPLATAKSTRGRSMS